MVRLTSVSAVLMLVILLALSPALSPDAEALAADCTSANITINSCKVSPDLIRVDFYADSPSRVEKLDYVFRPALGPELTYGVKSSPDLRDVSIRVTATNEYTFIASTERHIAEVHIFEPECLPEVYISSRAACELIGDEALIPEGSACADYPTIDTRVRCRFYNVEPPTVDIPEECRILGGTDRENCLSHHIELVPCLAEEDDLAALECAEGVIGLGNITAAKLKCDERALGSRPACIEPLREKVYRITRFKFQLLGRKAGSLLWEGVTEEVIVSFISNLEVRTQVFNSVDITQKISIINQVQQLWDEFLFNAEPQVLSHREEG